MDKYSDGTVLDVDALIAADSVTVASNNIAEVRGTLYTGAGASIGVPSQQSVASQIYAELTIDNVTGMTAIAGKIRLEVVYTDEGPTDN